MVKLSVVIPVFNVENYLIQCIESVINQKAKCELEIILVNDGSTDNSGIICDNYENIDSRIKVIHKSNGGLSSARNKGIDESTGEYIVFLDSDDFWIDNSLVHFVNTEEKTHADIIIGNAIKYEDEKKQFIEYPDNIKAGLQYKSRNDALKEILDNNFQWHVWKNFYKTNLIKTNKLNFMAGIIFEDVEWNPKVFLHANSLASFSEIFICYRIQRIGSITISPSKQILRLQDMLKATKSVTSYFNVVRIDKDLKDMFLTNFSKTYSYVFFRQTLLIDENSVALINQLSFLMKYYNGRYHRLLSLMLNVLGVNGVSVIFKNVGALTIKYNAIKRRGNKCQELET